VSSYDNFYILSIYRVFPEISLNAGSNWMILFDFKIRPAKGMGL